MLRFMCIGEGLNGRKCENFIFIWRIISDFISFFLSYCIYILK